MKVICDPFRAIELPFCRQVDSPTAHTRSDAPKRLPVPSASAEARVDLDRVVQRGRSALAALLQPREQGVDVGARLVDVNGTSTAHMHKREALEYISQIPPKLEFATPTWLARSLHVGNRHHKYCWKRNHWRMYDSNTAS